MRALHQRNHGYPGRHQTPSQVIVVRPSDEAERELLRRSGALMQAVSENGREQVKPVSGTKGVPRPPRAPAAKSDGGARGAQDPKTSACSQAERNNSGGQPILLKSP